jgi:parallel beta-helix repeat protein
MTHGEGVDLLYSNDNNLSGFEVNDSYGYGLRLYVSHRNVLDNGSVTNSTPRGIYAFDCDDNILDNLTVADSQQEGIYLTRSERNLVKHSTVERNFYGIYIYFLAHHNDIIDNVVRDSTLDGFYISSSDLNNVSGNQITNNSDGISLMGADLTEVHGNQFLANRNRGLRLDQSLSNRITHNTLEDHITGLFARSNANTNVIEDNDLGNNSEYGILFEDTTGQIVQRNTMWGNGLVVMGDIPSEWNHTIPTSDDNLLNGRPVRYRQGLTSGTIPPGASQVVIAECSQVSVVSQTLTDGTMGVQVGFSDNITLTDNDASGNRLYGIYLYETVDGILSGNIIANGLKIVGDQLAHWTHDISDTNTVDGKPLQYWGNRVGGTVPAGAGQVIFAATTGATVQDQYLANGSTAITIVFSDNITVANNTVDTNLDDGIHLFHSEHITLTDNIVGEAGASAVDVGILAEFSDHNTLSLNQATGNRQGIRLSNSHNNLLSENIVTTNVEEGIEVFLSSSNTLSGNTVHDNNGTTSYGFPIGAGIRLLGGSGNQLVGNDVLGGQEGIAAGGRDLLIAENTIGSFEVGLQIFGDTGLITNNTIQASAVGIYLSGNTNVVNNNTIVDNVMGILTGDEESSPGDTLVYHNGFFNNTVHALFNESQGGVEWDAGHPSGGNYWDDQVCPDLFSGELQDIPGADGLCDAPRIVEGEAEGMDRYPLVTPYTRLVIEDTTDPVIVLNGPADGSLIIPGTVIDLSVTDTNLSSVTYSLDGGADQPLAAPYDVDTSGWSEAGHSLVVNALDTAGNTAMATFHFQVDVTPPTIDLVSPENGSTIRAGDVIELDVDDPHLAFVNHSVDQGTLGPLEPPYRIDTSVWVPGTHDVFVQATDIVGNQVERTYVFTVEEEEEEKKEASPLVNPFIGTLVVMGLIILFFVVFNWREKKVELVLEVEEDKDENEAARVIPDSLSS